MIKALILTVLMAVNVGGNIDAETIIEEQTGLCVDEVRVMDEYGDAWGAYYCYCDGDIYCITIDDGLVDVCQILN